MATCENAPRKKRPRQGPRYQMEVNFPDEDSKKQFMSRLDKAKSLLSFDGSRVVDNFTLLSSMLDYFEQAVHVGHDAVPTTVQKQKFILKNSGVYTGVNDTEDGEELFICERETFRTLILELGKPCDCKAVGCIISSIIQIGHVVRVEFQCQNCHCKRCWASSRVFGGRYLINQKLVHGFTCAGIIPNQYINFSTFSGIGTVGKWYIRSVYKSMKYIDVINLCTESCFSQAVEEVKGSPGYLQSGEWVITDARHDSTANAYHTTVPCLSGSTHKILGCVTLSRKDHMTAQTRELACTKVVIPQVIEKGLDIVEVAHDNNASVKNYIVKDLKLVNSYDTWHGTKNVAKNMKSIAVGPVKKAGKTWFPELSDKRKSTKVHLYYCMKNCEQNPDKLRASILNIVDHYMGQHLNCNYESSCKKSGYVSSKVQLQDKDTIEAYTKKLKETLIYANAESYCHCRDTYWVESFNHHLLMYVPKRIHFGTDTFIMRINMACMDWNENVGRPSTSERIIQDTRRPDRRTPCRVLTKKSYQFVDKIWMVYVQKNSVDIRPDIEPLEIVEPDEDEMDEEDVLEDGYNMYDDDDGDYDEPEN